MNGSGIPAGDRYARLQRFVADSRALLNEAIEREITGAGKRLAGICLLFSGGNDSTVLAHLFADQATHAVHANTGIGIEQTRQFVRDCARDWHLPMLEYAPRPNDSYETLVMGKCRAQTGPNAGVIAWPGGFPGPAAHYQMYQRLKERALDRVKRELVANPARERVIFLAGRRASESARRAARFGAAELKPIERRGSAVWVSPLLPWSKIDLNTYRLVNPNMPHNEVTDMIHMSGECLCGAFARPGELDEIAMWDALKPTVFYIRGLEKRVQESGVAPPKRCRWGWGAGNEAPSRSGSLCSTCDARAVQLELFPASTVAGNEAA